MTASQDAFGSWFLVVASAVVVVLLYLNFREERAARRERAQPVQVHVTCPEGR